MARDNFSDLVTFLTVAREKSFTRAAAQFGVSQSALSHAIKAFEAKLGVRLLTRSTRGVSLTEAGERLVMSVGPRMEEIQGELASIAELRTKPSGTIRITATDFAIRTVINPKLFEFLREYPDVKVECISEYGFTDIIAERFDLGVRLGESISNGMIAVRIGPDVRMVIAGAPSYLDRHAAPRTPQELLEHSCINLRIRTHGGLYAWELRKGKLEHQVHVEGQHSFSGIYEILDATLAGCGLAYMPEDLVKPYIASGQLKLVLEDWSPTFTGYHIYFPNRRQQSRALELLVDTLRYRG